MSLFDGPVKKINILINYYRSSVCLTAVVIFARLRWWGRLKKLYFYIVFISFQETHLPAVDVLDRPLPEEEVDVVSVGKRLDKVGS